MTTLVNTSRIVDNSLDLKFLAIGDSGVGKTCLLNQYVDEKFLHTLGTTVGVDIRHKNVLHKSNKTNKSYTVHLQLWDTAGQERYRSLTTSFFRDAMGFLLVFDLTNESSFISVRNWIEEVRANAYSENVDFILVGNKSDLENERIIRKPQAMELAQQYKIEYIETSALENRNVTTAVELLLKRVIGNLEINDNFPPPNPPISSSSNVNISPDDFENSPVKKPMGSVCCNY